MSRPGDFKLGYVHFGGMDNFKDIISRFSASHVFFPKSTAWEYSLQLVMLKKRGVPVIHVLSSYYGTLKMSVKITRVPNNSKLQNIGVGVEKISD